MKSYDIPYLILLFTLIILAFYTYYKKNNISKISKLALGIMFCFVAFRAPVVGGDTYDYMQTFLGTSTDMSTRRVNAEMWFIWYQYISRIVLFSSTTLHIFVNTCISLIPLFYLLRKYSNNVPLSLVFFMTFDIMLLYFTALREILGLGVIMIGMAYLLGEQKGKKKLMVYAICLFLAYNFQHMLLYYGIAFLILYFIPFKRYLAIAVVTASALAGIVLQSFHLTDFFNYIIASGYSDMFNDRISIYIEHTLYADNTISSSLYTLNKTFIAVFVLWFLDDRYVNHWFTKLFVAGVIIYNLFATMPMITRIITPFLMFVIFTLPWLIERRDLITKKNYVFITIFALIFLYQVNVFITWDTTLYDRMHPYSFFFQDYDYIPWYFD